MASSLRNSSLSLYYRVWTILVQAGWTIQETDVAMDLITDDNDLPDNTYWPSDETLRLPLVFVDTNMHPMPSGMKVYDDGIPMPSTDYVVDWLNGMVSLNSPASGDVTADATFFTVRVVEGYPDTETLTRAQLPIVSVQMDGETAEPLGVGTGHEIRDQRVMVDLLANSEGERQDLFNDLRRRIRAVPFFDMSSHQYIGEDGDIDPIFSVADNLIGRANYLEHPRGEFIERTIQSHEKEKWRATITFSIKKIE